VPQGEDGSVSRRLGAVTWSPEDGVAYEVALEGINQIVGAYSGLIGREEASESPDVAAIESWHTAQGEWASIRKALSPADPDGVKRVRALCRTLLPELRGQRGA
jgi:hypothetical protein